MQNDLFNVNFAVFLSHLRSYAKNHSLIMSQSTSDMMEEVVNLFDDIYAKSTVKVGPQNDVHFISQLHSDDYELRTNIMCLLCSVCVRNSTSGLNYLNFGIYSPSLFICKIDRIGLGFCNKKRPCSPPADRSPPKSRTEKAYRAICNKNDC